MKNLMIGTVMLLVSGASLSALREEPTTLSRVVAGDGAVFALVASPEGTTVVSVHRSFGAFSGTSDVRVDLEGRIVESGAIVPWKPKGGSDEAVVVLVIPHESGHEYRFALVGIEGWPEDQTLSEPFFESEGQPFRIVEARALSNTADGLEVTLRRGQFPLDNHKREGAAVEEVVYVDSCTPAMLAGSHLYDARTGELLRSNGKVR